MRDHWFDEHGNFQPDAVRDIEVGGRALYNSSLENGPARPPAGEPGVRCLSEKEIAHMHVCREARVAEAIAGARKIEERMGMPDEPPWELEMEGALCSGFISAAEP